MTDTTESTHSTDVTWEPPGPGTWERDVSHAPAAGTPAFRRVMKTAISDAYREVFEDYGAPLETIQVEMVRGGMYRRVVPLVGADKGDKPPPRPILWAATRLHPKMRKRNKRAVQLFDEKFHLVPLDNWESTERFDWIARNQAIQSEPIAQMTDVELADHVGRVEEQLYAGNHRHHILHGTDMGPIGDVLAHCERWKVDLPAVMRLLQGASPATREAGRMGADIAAALRSEGVDPTSVTALDAYLDLYGWRIVSSYDIEGKAVCELPSTVLALIKAGADWTEPDDTAVEELRAEVRSQVPAGNRSEYEELLDDARRAYGRRDDNGPLTAEWPIGLTRRAYLEAGRRLVSAGRMSEDARVFELDTDELAAVLHRRLHISLDHIKRHYYM
ncbi:MAG: hypothetical protein P8N02_10010, partial [Actinomycetota bacterium]|nr:hypothetical protein [Actinomycetota bacterium]